tara:strand:- start:140 stop:598 length:459 start_codon:yes stop_codon:yes gene_type:complete
METTNEFKVSEVDGKVVIAQTITKIMDVKESVTELQKLIQEKNQIQQQKDKQQVYIDTEQYKKDLDATLENIKNLDKLETDWNAIIAPALDKMRVEYKEKIIAGKKEEKYDELESTKKILAKNKIMSNVCTEMALDTQHPIVQEVRREFDNL